MWLSGTELSFIAQVGIVGGNASQQLKEFAKMSGYNVLQLEHRTSVPVRSRAKRAHVAFGIKTAMPMSAIQLRKAEAKLIEDGVYEIGQPCFSEVTYR